MERAASSGYQRQREPRDGFILDMDVCRKTFDAFDRDRSGYLDLDELGKLAEALWNTFHPEGPKLDRESKAVDARLLLCLF